MYQVGDVGEPPLGQGLATCSGLSSCARVKVNWNVVPSPVKLGLNEVVEAPSVTGKRTTARRDIVLDQGRQRDVVAVERTDAKAYE